MMRLGALAGAAAVSTVLLLLPTTAAGTETPALDPAAVIAIGERAVGRSLGNYRLVDSTGKPLSLSEYRGKPLVISLVYSSCSSICPATTQHLIDAVTEARRVFGPDRFAVLTVGFDARNDTVPRMAQFASIQGIKIDNWRVASGDAATIAALLNDIGFSYRAVAGGFDHPAQTTILGSDSKVYRHVYGDDFPLPMFMEPMKDVIYGNAGTFSFSGVFDRIKFICTTYDPGSRRYRVDFGLLFGAVIAGFSLVGMAGLILREWIRSTKAAA